MDVAPLGPPARHAPRGQRCGGPYRARNWAKDRRFRQEQQQGTILTRDAFTLGPAILNIKHGAAMPLQRQFASIPAERTLVELLVEIQLEGHLKNFKLPSWAPGTSVAELFEALSMIGNGQWMHPISNGSGVNESADAWLLSFMRGAPVPTYKEVQRSIYVDGADELSDHSDKGFANYVGALRGDSKKRFATRRAQPGWAGELSKHFVKVQTALGHCADLMPDADFEALSFAILSPAIAGDAELSEVSVYMLGEHAANVFVDLFDLEGPAFESAKRRAAWLSSRLPATPKSTEKRGLWARLSG